MHKYLEQLGKRCEQHAAQWKEWLMIQQARQVRNVFISHPQSEASREWVRAFANSLQSQGANVWLEEADAHAKKSYPAMLERALRRSDLFVFVISPDSLNRPSVMFEIGAAVGARKPLISVVPEGFDPSRLPEPLRLRKQLSQSSPDETAHRLMSSVGERANPKNAHTK